MEKRTWLNPNSPRRRRFTCPRVTIRSSTGWAICGSVMQQCHSRRRRALRGGSIVAIHARRDSCRPSATTVSRRLRVFSARTSVYGGRFHVGTFSQSQATKGKRSAAVPKFSGAGVAFCFRTLSDGAPVSQLQTSPTMSGPRRSTVAIPSLAAHQRIFGRALRPLAVHRAFGHMGNKAACQGVCVKRVCINSRQKRGEQPLSSHIRTEPLVVSGTHGSMGESHGA